MSLETCENKFRINQAGEVLEEAERRQAYLNWQIQEGKQADRFVLSREGPWRDVQKPVIPGISVWSDRADAADVVSMILSNRFDPKSIQR
jgi:hypothetical protein